MSFHCFRLIFTALLALPVALLTGAGSARALDLALPVACTYGEDCTIQNYFDWTDGEEYTDYRCGTRSYDGHGETDFRIMDMAALAAGVPVVAAAPGVVQAVRDGMEDVTVNRIGRETIKGRECGNGVVLFHDGGWSTQYCHLKKGSIRVAQGDRVATGAALGDVGHSGLAEFPHLAFIVRKGDRKIDPFIGLGQRTGCGAPSGGLWRGDVADDLTYRQVELFGIGFSGDTPSLERINETTASPAVLPTSNPLLFLQVRILGLLPEHQVRLKIKAPDGQILIDHTPKAVNRSKAQQAYWVGKRRPDGGWPEGTYQGQVTILGAEGVLDDQTITLRMED